MSFGHLSSGAVSALALVAGFLVCVGYEAIRKRRPLSEEVLTSNSGSVMSYLVWLAAINAALSLAMAAALIGSAAMFHNRAPAVVPWILPALFLAAGLAYGHASILRARDAGRSRWFVLLGLVPIGNFVLAFAPPKDEPGRPPYRPSSGWARVVIGLCAVAVVVASRPFDRFVAQTYLDMRVADRVRRDGPGRVVPLPQDLADTTTLQGIDTDGDTRMIIYRYRLAGAVSDRERITAWVETAGKQAIGKSWCGDPVVADVGWSVWSEYSDAAADLIARTFVSPTVCRAMAR